MSATLKKLRKMSTEEVLTIAKPYGLRFNRWYQKNTFALWRQFCHVLAGRIQRGELREIQKEGEK